MTQPTNNYLDLSNTEPLSDAGRQRLREIMVTDKDRAIFDRIVERTQTMCKVNRQSVERIRDKLLVPSGIGPWERDRKSRDDFWRRIEARDLKALAHSVVLREAPHSLLRAQDREATADARQTIDAQRPPRLRDDRMLGPLKDVPALSDQERQQLFEAMRNAHDKAEFHRIVKRHRIEPVLPDEAPAVDSGADAQRVRAFGDEFCRRSEAKALRELAGRVRERAHDRVLRHEHER